MPSAGSKVNPLLRQFKAWWEGYYLDAERASGSRPAGPPAPAKQSAPLPEEKKNSDNTVLPIHLRKAAAWTDTRLQVAELIWGQGFLGPGDPEQIANWILPLGLDSKVSVLNLGAGLGGVARAITVATGAWVTGYEGEPHLVEAGMELSTMRGLAKRAPIVRYDPEKPGLKANSAIAVIAKEALFTVQNKQRLLKDACNALRSEGHLLMTDFMLKSETGGTDDLAEWAAHEPRPVFPWVLPLLKQSLEELKFDVRIVEEVSKEMRATIEGPWLAARTKLKEGKFPPGLGAAMKAEADLWFGRLAALERGSIGVYRIYAWKKPSGTVRR